MDLYGFKSTTCDQTRSLKPKAEVFTGEHQALHAGRGEFPGEKALFCKKTPKQIPGTDQNDPQLLVFEGNVFINIILWYLGYLFQGSVGVFLKIYFLKCFWGAGETSGTLAYENGHLRGYRCCFEDLREKPLKFNMVHLHISLLKGSLEMNRTRKPPIIFRFNFLNFRVFTKNEGNGPCLKKKHVFYPNLILNLIKLETLGLIRELPTW